MRVLFITHNHPSLHPGGSEILAHDLFQAVKAEGVEAMFLACTNAVHRQPKPGTNFQTVGRSGDEMLLWAGHFDAFNLSQIDLHGLVPELGAFLTSWRPDVVHFHHALLIGAETIYLVRRLLPEARIVFTLHDYYAICAHLGQMVTAGDNALCRAARPDACAKCFPDIGPERFTLRKKHLQTLYGLVDQFLSPSEFLRQRYIDWGLPAERIMVMHNGRPAVEPVPHREAERRDVFGYFGNLSPFKGVLVAAEAMARLGVGELRIHGGTPFQSEDFKGRLASAMETPNVTALGAYQAAEIPKLMAEVDWVIVPSIWWENAPLVIQEAFQHKRPVICSDIGGMAEMVADGVNGLHFRTGDPLSLARALRRAIDEPWLWRQLVEGIPAILTTTDIAARHLEVYRGQRRLAA
jgi:glycosyltransferase involved in cell wall biosynthesis